MAANYLERRGEIETYFDRTAADAWARLTSDAPVGRVRASVRAGRDRMRGTPGIAATVFSALGASGINVIAISQGSSERNISLAGMRKLTKRGWVDGDEEYLVANRYRKSMNIKAPTVDVVVGKLSGGNIQKLRRQRRNATGMTSATPACRRGIATSDSSTSQSMRKSGMAARISLTAGKAWMTSPSDEVFTSRTLLTITGAAWAVANARSLHDIAVSA